MFYILVVQNNGKGKTKKRAAHANLLFVNQKKKCAARTICFLLIRSISLEAIFIVVSV